jgi:hypothetical protein
MQRSFSAKEKALKSQDFRAFFSLFVVNRVVIAPYFDPYRLVRIARVKRKKQRGCRKSCMSRNVRHTNRNICLLSGVSMLDAILFLKISCNFSKNVL